MWNLCTGWALCVILCFILHETLFFSSNSNVKNLQAHNIFVASSACLPLLNMCTTNNFAFVSQNRHKFNNILSLTNSLSFRKENNSCDSEKKNQKNDSKISYKHALLKDKSSNSRKTKTEYGMFTCTLIVRFLCWVGVFAAECTVSSSWCFVLNLNTCENKQNGKVLFRHEMFTPPYRIPCRNRTKY
jgi:hypothetical protein